MICLICTIRAPPGIGMRGFFVVLLHKAYTYNSDDGVRPYLSTRSSHLFVASSFANYVYDLFLVKNEDKKNPPDFMRSHE